MRQALAALVDNALRHTPAGAAVTVSAGRNARGVFLAVADDGPGVDPETVEQLFSRFRRGETRGEGSGLGLTLVRALAEAHGGGAYLENIPSGGARAVLELPAGAAAQSGEAA